MAGLVLSIAVLATGTIVPNVEAMKPTVDPLTGIKIQCKIPKGGPQTGHLFCKMTSGDGIGDLSFSTPLGSEGSGTNLCPNKIRSITFDNPFQEGDYTFTVTKCGGGTSVFVVTVTGGQITNIAVIP